MNIFVSAFNKKTNAPLKGFDNGKVLMNVSEELNQSIKDFEEIKQFINRSANIEGYRLSDVMVTISYPQLDDK